MSVSAGIVGLPNVGKSTLFNALTSQSVSASNFPFCTIDPNVGVVVVPDPRLEKIADIIKPAKTTHTTVEFVDIAGLVKGASRGEGLGNQFLGRLREVDAILHIVRCFEDPNVVHVEGSVDAKRDIETIQTELGLADLETVMRAIKKAKTQAKSGDKALLAKGTFLEKIHVMISKGESVQNVSLSPEETSTIADLHLLTAKPILYVCNVDEESLGHSNPSIEVVQELAKKEGSHVIQIAAKVEAEIVELPAEEQETFRKDLGLKESGLSKLITATYKLLNLITFFTTLGPECRAWTVTRGTYAPKAAGAIHTDFEKGFIRAEIYPCEELFTHGSEATLRSKGLLHIQGKEYVICDGDVVQFRFNV